MKDFNNKLIKIAEKVVNNLKHSLDVEKINASGKLKDSIKWSVSEHFITITMNDYGAYVDEGTGPSKSTSGSGFYDKIKEWTQYKHIPIDASYPIYRKILREGINKHKWINIKETIMSVDKEMLEMIGIMVDEDFNKRFERVFQ